MSESGLHSEETSEGSGGDETEYSDDEEYSSDGSEYSESSVEQTDGEYREEMAAEGEDYSDTEGSRNVLHRMTAAVPKSAAGYGERAGLLPLHGESPAEYRPERWPPLLDFLFVFSSFVAAVVAAYFTLF